MKRVLLAIAGETPNQRIFDYTVQLCLRIKARLNILQIVGPGGLKESAGRIRNRVDRFRRIVDTTMTAVTFAEAGEPYPRKLPASAEKSIFDDLTVRSGPADREIIHYIDSRRDIVLAVYDPKLEDRKKQALPAKLKEAVSIPLVKVSV